jgi:hypothetical protein
VESEFTAGKCPRQAANPLKNRAMRYMSVYNTRPRRSTRLTTI